MESIRRIGRLGICLLLWVVSSPAWAEHLVGGEIWYDYLGNNRYRITLRIYRDCNSSGATLDPQAAITAFD